MVTRLISRSRHALMSLLTPLVTVEEEDDGNVDSMTATAATEGFGGSGNREEDASISFALQCNLF